MTNTMATPRSFNILTFNIWGLPFGIASDKTVRINAIGKALHSLSCDVICLQELWTKNDYNILKKYLKDSHPFRHYYDSGLIGSGLCIFSKWPIEETFYYQFPVNGWFHMIHHGDWYGGKGVGLAKINLNGLKINVYNSHLHANYSDSSKKDPYFVHRLVQSLDAALFIKHTSHDADLSVFGGDLNSTPDDLCIKLLLHLADLEDTTKVTLHNEDQQETCDSKRNSYRRKGLAKEFPGHRIDYILFKARTIKVGIVKCIFPLEMTIPGTKISYSDHEAVSAEFSVTELTSEIELETDKFEERRKHLKEALLTSLDCCRIEINVLKMNAVMFFYYVLLMIAILIMLPFLTHDVVPIKVVIGSIILLICFLIACICTRLNDRAWLKNAKKRIKVYVRTL